MNKLINQGTVETTLTFSVGGGVEHEAKLDIRYVVHPGCKGSRTEPAEADTVEIVHVRHDGECVSSFIFDVCAEDSDIAEACLADWRARISHQHSDAADARRDERRWRVA